jgi:hypothetical protein
MSCVIGLKYGDKVYMGQDGLAYTEDGEIKQRRLHNDNFKI